MQDTDVTVLSDSKTTKRHTQSNKIKKGGTSYKLD